MSVEKFKIIDLVKEFITVADENLVNFPKKEIELKQEIKRRGYDLLLAVNEANVTSDETKRRNLIESAIALVKQLDFLIKTCAEKQIINYRKYYKRCCRSCNRNYSCSNTSWNKYNRWKI